MSEEKPNKTDSSRRWWGLMFGIILFGLLITISIPSERAWIHVSRLILAFGFLALGIYDFIKNRKPKDAA